MMDPEVLRFIRQEVARQLNVILNAESGSNSQEKETIQKLFPGMPNIDDRPIMHPYGFVSRAVKGTISVVARVGEHFGNRMTIGHRDKSRPKTLQEGESAIYSLKDYEVRVLNDKIQVGKGGTWETVVMGETLKALLSDLLDALVQHTHPAPGAPPTNAAAFSALKSSPVGDGKILAKDGGKF